MAFDFQGESFDRIFMVAVLGEVKNKISYMAELHRLLKCNGILSISKVFGDPAKMTVKSMKKLGVNSGLSFYKYYGNRWNYTINFLKE